MKLGLGLSLTSMQRRRDALASVIAALFGNDEKGIVVEGGNLQRLFSDVDAETNIDGPDQLVAAVRESALDALITQATEASRPRYLRAITRGLDLEPDFWIDAVSGDDSNAGTSEGAAWKSLNKMDGINLSAGQTITVRVKSGIYQKETDLISLSQNAIGATLNIVFEPGCINDGTAYTVANSTGSFFDTVNPKQMNLYGNGCIVSNWTMGTANGLGGNGQNADCSYDAYDFEVFNCGDGLSCHGSMSANYYDCLVYDCVKAAVAHIDGTNTTHTRCKFIEVAGGGTGNVVIANGQSAIFTDCVMIPGGQSRVLGLDNSTVIRCWLGDLSNRASLTSRKNVTIIDSFLNVSFDTNATLTIINCYGRLTARQRNGGSLTMEGCVISGPASGQSNIFFSNFNPGSGSPHIIRNNIFETASASAFMNYDANNAGHVVAAASQFHNNILSGSAAFDSNLVAADTEGTVIVDNISADALIGAANTHDPDDYGYGAGSPAIGAATDGGNSGFAVGEVAARVPLGTGRPFLGHLENTDDASLPATLPDLGTDATLAYATDEGVTILTGQTIGAGDFEVLRDKQLFALIVNDRPWTADETNKVTKYLERQTYAV